MEFPVLLTIRLDNESEHELMQRVLGSTKKWCASTAGMASAVPLLERAQLRRFDGKQARLLIGGRVVATGNLEDITTKYATECGIHKSNVSLEEWIDGEYKQTKSRIVRTGASIS